MPEDVTRARDLPEPTAGPPAQGGRGDLRTGLLVVVTIILLGWAMRAMAVVLVPLVSAILIALAVMPVRDAVRARVPGWLGWLGQLAAMSIIVLLLALFFGGISIAAREIVGQMPVDLFQADGTDGEGTGGEEPDSEGPGPALAEGAARGVEAAADDPVENREEARDDGGEGEAEDGGGGLLALLPGESWMEMVRDLGERVAGAAAGAATAVLNSVLGLVAGLVLIFFLTLLILFESGEWRRKLREVAQPHLRWRLLESAEVIAEKVRRYLLVQAALGLATAALYAAWLWFWDVELVLVWAILTLLLVFIPTVGSLVAGILPVVFTLLTQDLGSAVGVGLGLLAIEQVMGNFAEPRFQGRNIALSPLVILASLTFWVWVWGLAGALLAVPVTVALVVLGAHVPATRPWALMLSDQTDIEGLREATRPEK